MKVVVIGQGYVGLNVAVAASEYYEVIGFDVNENLIKNLSKGISHIEDISSEILLSRIESGNYRASSQAKDLNNAEVIVIAVPTPLDSNRKPDLKFIESVCKLIGHNVTHPSLVINESTSFPGTLRKLIKKTIEENSVSDISHLYAISPERVDPGRTDFNQRNTPRLYSGLTQKASEKTREFYSKFCDELVEVTSPEVAEAAKLFENTFRQVNIALVNEFAQITHSLGISVYETLEAANTKPYGFMKFNPGAGVGGHCIPVDPTYLALVAEENGVPATFITRANEVNHEMPRYIVDRVVKDHGGSIKGKKALVVGVAYKPNVADTRETPAKSIISFLRKKGAEVAWHDELVGSWNNEKSSPLVSSEIIIVVTKHSSVDSTLIMQSAPYVFDTTGLVAGAHQL